MEKTGSPVTTMIDKPSFVLKENLLCGRIFYISHRSHYCSLCLSKRNALSVTHQIKQ